jgi:hypothetical protein
VRMFILTARNTPIYSALSDRWKSRFELSKVLAARFGPEGTVRKRFN